MTHQPPRMQITWRVLEGALEAGDADVVAACRRVIVANRLGWRKYGNPADLQLILAFA